MAPSASALPHRDRDECRFHQSATAVVVIIRIGVKPEKDANQNATSPKKGELKHRQPKAGVTLIRMLRYRHLTLIATVSIGDLFRNSLDLHLWRHTRLVESSGCCGPSPDRLTPVDFCVRHPSRCHQWRSVCQPGEKCGAFHFR